MNSSLKSRSLLLTLLLAAALLFSSATLCRAELTEAGLARDLQEKVVDAPLEKHSPTATQLFIARVAVEALLQHHYSQPQMTGAVMAQWYQNYFLMLDPGKNYFLRSDLEEFRAWEDRLYQRNQPDLNFAYTVYQRFLQRLQEWCIYSFQAYQQDFDFSQKEYLDLADDPDDREWPLTVEEQQDRWRKMVKNALLSDRLTQEDLKKAQAQEPADGEHHAVYTPPPVRLRNQNALINTYRTRLEAEPLEILSLFVNAFATLLDPHSCYYAPEAKEDFDISMSLSLQGIGATLTWRDSYTVVMSLVPGGPAALDGRLRPGDRIIAVAQNPDDEPTVVIGMPLSKVVRQIRGKKGTQVYLTVLPEGGASEKTIVLTRDEIRLKDSEAQSDIHTIDGKRVLCIYLPSFYRDFEGVANKNKNAKSTTRDVLRLLSDAQKTGPVDGLVLDMRNNGGGSLEEAILLSGAFLEGQSRKGIIPNPVVQTRAGTGAVQVRTAPSIPAAYTGPLMVLVDRGAASATEILAACLQDSERAVVVGDSHTHGKGTVQSLVDLNEVTRMRQNQRLLDKQEPGSLKITIQKFYRVTGGSTQKLGVTPDIILPSFLEAFKNTESDLPHVLAWDEISPVRHYRHTNLKAFLPKLQEFYQSYANTNPEFLRYARDVKEYIDFRENRKLPLEFQEARKYRDQETALARKWKHYQPERDGDKNERLHEADEAIYDDGAPREDVVLDASLAIMGEMMRIDQANDNNAFSIQRKKK